MPSGFGGCGAARLLKLSVPASCPPPQMIMMQHKQRHHLINQYIHNPAKARLVLCCRAAAACADGIRGLHCRHAVPAHCRLALACGGGCKQVAASARAANSPGAHPAAALPAAPSLQDRVSKPQTMSPFLEQFYKSN